jgi:hypothetical protein
LLKRCTPKGYPGFESLPHRSFLLEKPLLEPICKAMEANDTGK